MKLNDSYIRKLIKEEINSILEAAKEGFTFENLLKFQTYKERLSYCHEMLGQPIGNGSSRMVFQISDERVLKIAKNRKGIAQNEFESEYGKSNYNIFPKIYNIDQDNNIFIECEYVLPCKTKDFKKVLGITFNEFKDFVIYTYNCYVNKNEALPTEMSDERFTELIEGNDNLRELYTYMCDYQLTAIGDLLRIQNLGLVMRNGYEWIVVLDDGLNEDIYQEFYKKI